MKHFLYFLLFTLLINSCTIHNRVHRKGVTIQWKNHKSKSNVNQSSSPIEISNKSVASQEITVEKEEEKRSIEKKKPKEKGGIRHAEHTTQHLETAENKTPQTIQLTPKNNGDGTAEEQDKKVEGFGVAGLIAALSGIIIVFFVSILIAMLLAVIAIVFGAIGLRRFLNDPEKYGGNGLAVASLTLGIILLLVSVIFLVILL